MLILEGRNSRRKMGLSISIGHKTAQIYLQQIQDMQRLLVYRESAKEYVQLTAPDVLSEKTIQSTDEKGKYLRKSCPDFLWETAS